MDIAQEIRDRIIAVANALYEDAGRATIPTVAAVRSRSAADMNAASIVMREWRRALTVPASPGVIEVPDKLRATHLTALAGLWSEAQTLANEGLRAAQAAWDTERAEAEQLRGELSEAFESLRRELDVAQVQIARQVEQMADQHRHADAARAELAAAMERIGIAETRTEEIQRRANDLAHELTRVHDESKAERDRHTEALATHRAELDQARSTLLHTTAAAESARDQARKDASQAREEAARLQGRVEAMTTQHADLMRAFTLQRESSASDASASLPAAPRPRRKKGT